MLFSKRIELQNSENTLTNFKIFISRATGPISSKLGTKHPWVKGIQRGDNYEIAKIHRRNFKNLLLQNHGSNFNETWHKASFGEGDSRLTSTKKDLSVVKTKMIGFFFSPNQRYDTIIALSRCVYWFNLISQVSDVAYGPLFFLFFFKCWKRLISVPISNLIFNMYILLCS